MDNLYFNSWESIVRIIILTILAYTSLVILLRSFGKRTLSKMNAFDFIVTIALGSSLATVILSKNISLADGLAAFFCLIFLQYIITWISVRWHWFKTVITSQPSLLVYRGELLPQVIKKERITMEEINLAIREKEVSHIKDVDVLILETTGDFTVIPKLSDAESSVFTDVRHFDRAIKQRDQSKEI